MREEALLLTQRRPAPSDGNLVKILRFFGVSSHLVNAAESLAELTASASDPSKLRLLCSSGSLLGLIENLENAPEAVRSWRETVHSVFVHAADADSMQTLARRLTGDGHALLLPVDSDAGEWAVAENLPELCGAMSGVRVPAGTTTGQLGLAFDSSTAVRIIAARNVAGFIKLYYQGVPVFLSTSTTIVDLDADVGRSFDIRDHFLPALPIVLYVTWAFPQTCWRAPEINACLVIDDPLLKPRYGFVNYQSLLALMVQREFSTNIAFIPWNYRRSAKSVVRLFKQHPDRYSLSMHGCDHTAGEFGTFDIAVAARRVEEAVDRMRHHESSTGVRHDRVMVFPQGVFSGTAMRALKHANFTAAVNTEIISVDPAPPTVKIADVWDIAVMNYGDFPVFTRRYPWQGVENFAFDMLLGKPCIVVIHHDFCRDQYSHLIEFIDRLNAVKCPLIWRGLGDVVTRGCRQREVSPDTVEVTMYGTELRIVNRSHERRRFRIVRRESDPSTVKSVRAAARSLTWKFVDGHVGFEIDLAPGKSERIVVEFHALADSGRGRDGLRYRVKTMLRRYLSEVRDNYVTRK